MSRRVLFLLLFFSVLNVVAAGSAWSHQENASGVIRFGVFPYKSPKPMVELFAPVASRLEQKLGRKVQLVTAPDAETFMARSKNREYDLALPCVTCFFRIQPYGYKVIARGTPPFHGGVLVRKESDIQSITQLRGRKVAATAEHSYGGYLFCRAQLDAQGIDPDKDVEFHFLGKQDSVIMAVANGKFEAGVVRVDALDSPAFASIREQLREVSRSVEIPQFPFVVGQGIDEKTVAVIREVLTSLSPEVAADAEILSALQVRKIVAAEDADYDRIRHLTKDLPYFK
ncbi:MAG: phosphate/phosphite/phosphonate ABC transporter substrate-binding protein [Thermodesulfobacteriota bacterium]